MHQNNIMNNRINDNVDEKINVNISKMKREHIPQIAGIEAEVFSMPWSARAFADALGMEHTLFFTASVEEKVAGYCGCYIAADEGEITNVAVAPEYRRNKIAEMLLREVLAKAKEKGAQQIFLEVRSSNEPAVQLYKKTGFQTVGSRKDYYRNPTEDALVMMYIYADK